MSFSSIPLSTYRFQFHEKFPIKEAIKQDLPQYLKDLGISYAYSSPLLRARPGSTHGYDVVDHDQINPEIATNAEFDKFSAQLRQQNLGLLLDIVPNHIGVAHPTSRWWMDVLEFGQSSPHADHFDINWEAIPHKGRLLIACLGSPLGKVIEEGELKVVWNPENVLASVNNDLDPKAGAFQLHYYSNVFPIDPVTLVPVLESLVKDRKDAELQSCIDELKKIEPRGDVSADVSNREARIARWKKLSEIKKRLSDLMADKDRLAAVQKGLDAFNGKKDDVKSFDALFELVSKQPYRLAYWKVANDELNYRRFFDVNELMAIRVEDDYVFQAAHKLILKLVKEGKVNGLRLDHPDGLFDPLAYTQKLQVEVSKNLPADYKSRDKSGRPFFILIEKILEPGEELSKGWNVQGTVGYDYMNILNGVFVDVDNEKVFRKIYSDFTGLFTNETFEQLLYKSKKLIMETSMETELISLARILFDIAQMSRRNSDFSLKQLKGVMAELVAYFPVYRTYVTGETTEKTVTQTDRDFILKTTDLVRKKSFGIDPLILQFVEDLLLVKNESSLSAEEVTLRKKLRSKFQQTTGPVMAKGLEDTSFYRFFLLTSLNEVGGDPNHFGMPKDKFEEINVKRAQDWNTAMSGTSTHDTKRSEDVRSRLNVLSEIPDIWRDFVSKLAKLGEKFKTNVDEIGSVPESNEEYFIYQTLVGAWPLGATKADEDFSKRIEAYFLKSAHEAKVRTTWTIVNEPYENALKKFLTSILNDSEFVKTLLGFQNAVSALGKLNSLSQVVLKLTCPGIPDVYQGNETWDFSLVDPDNRRLVDFPSRKKTLTEVRALLDSNEAPTKFLTTSLENSDDGKIKMYLTSALLRLRNQHEDLFLEGDYTPLKVDGPRAKNVIAYQRKAGGKTLVVATSRFFTNFVSFDKLTSGNVESQLEEALRSGWGETSVQAAEAGQYLNVLTRANVDLSSKTAASELFKEIPFAVLLKK